MRRISALGLTLLLLLGVFAISNKYAPVASANTVTSGPSGTNKLRAYPGPGKGEVTLEWQRVSLSGENYSVKYGLSSGNYIYQVPKIGYVATYTVKSLQPGKRYYFAIDRIWSGNINMGSGGEVSAVAPGSSTVVLGTSGPVGRNSLVGKPGSKSGEITLSWWKYFDDTTGYSLVYGEQPGQYKYGVANAVTIKNSSQQQFTFTVGQLKPGRRYYLALIPLRTGTSGGAYITSEVSVVAR